MRLFKKNKKEKIKKKKDSALTRYLYLVLGCFLLAISFNMFFSPNNIVTGGMSGLSIVVHKVFGISTTSFIFVVYILLLFVSYIFLGMEKTKYSLMGSILYPIFVYLTRDISVSVKFDVDNLLLVTMFGALCSGIGSGLVFKYGFSTGGSDIICQIISKYFKVSIGEAIKITNTVILLGAGFFIGGAECFYAWENVMYACVAVYIISFLNDKVLLGISNSKSFYIITENETAIKKFLINELNRGVTVLEGRGGYTGDRKKILLCVIPTKEYFLAKEGILKIDESAIILINDVYQSSGIE